MVRKMNVCLALLLLFTAWHLPFHLSNVSRALAGGVSKQLLLLLFSKAEARNTLKPSEEAMSLLRVPT